MLAYKLGNQDALRILCDHGINPKFKPFTQIKSAYELAIEQKNREVLKIFIQANQKIKQIYLDENKQEMFEVLESIPDFQIHMSFECESSLIPFLKSFTPHDTFKIYKYGSNIRLDFQNKTVQNQINQDFKKKQGSIGKSQSSFLFKGRNSSNEGELLYAEQYLDNQKRQRGYVMNVLTDMYTNKIDQEIDKLLRKKEKAKEYQALSVNLENFKDWRGMKVMKQIDGYHAQKMKAKAKFLIIQQSQNQIEKKLDDLKNIRSLNFEQYINKSKVDASNIQTYLEKKTQIQPRSQSQSKIKKQQKEIQLELYTVQDYPINVETLRPLFHILGFASKNISKFNDFIFNQVQISKDQFPISATIPLFMTVKANINFTNFKFLNDSERLPSNFFDLDEEIQLINQNLIQNNPDLIYGNQFGNDLQQDINYDKILKDLNVQLDITNESSQMIDSRMMINNQSITSEQGKLLYDSMLIKQEQVNPQNVINLKQNQPNNLIQSTYEDMNSQDFSERINNQNLRASQQQQNIVQDLKQKLAQKDMIVNFKTMQDIYQKSAKLSTPQSKQKGFNFNTSGNTIKMSGLTNQILNQQLSRMSSLKDLNPIKQNQNQQLINQKQSRDSKILDFENIIESRVFTPQQIQMIKSIKLPSQKNLVTLNQTLQKSNQIGNQRMQKNVKNILKYQTNQSQEEQKVSIQLQSTTRNTAIDTFAYNTCDAYTNHNQGPRNQDHFLLIDEIEENTDVQETMLNSESTIDMRLINNDKENQNNLYQENNYENQDKFIKRQSPQRLQSKGNKVIDMKKYQTQLQNKRPQLISKASFVSIQEKSPHRQNSLGDIKFQNQDNILCKTKSAQRNKKFIDADLGELEVMNTWGISNGFSLFNTNQNLQLKSNLMSGVGSGVSSQRQSPLVSNGFQKSSANQSPVNNLNSKRNLNLMNFF
eukprot:403372077